jgi:quercetin dioxygenase-like cupin family protein
LRRFGIHRHRRGRANDWRQTGDPQPDGGPAEGYVTVTARAEIDAGAMVARHTHPGIESTYVVEGGLELNVDGQAARQLQPGDAFEIAAGTPHGAKGGAARTVLASTYVVEKGKPLASPA